jgi:hypothetical protein
MEDSNKSSEQKVQTPTLDRNSTGLSDKLNDFSNADEPIEGGSLAIDKTKTETITEVDDEPAIDAGFVSEANKQLPFHKEKHQAETSQKLAFSLVGVLVVTIAIHYATTIVLELYGHHNAVESIEKIFNSCLPVIAGFVGAAVTYYLTKDK